MNKSRIVAILLALFLGGFGFHKFYLNKNVQGIFYFAFCWTFLPSILGGIDAVILMLTNDNKFNKKYGT